MARKPLKLADPTKAPLPLIADLHLREESLGTCLAVLRGMRQEAPGFGAQEVGILGDVGHVRGLIPVRMQNALVEELDAWAQAGLRAVIIPGNHDQIDVQGRHALEALRTHPAVRLHERPTVDQHGLWIPFREDLAEIRQVLDQHRGKVERVFWHGPMLGAAMNDFRKCELGLVPEDFRGYAIAMLGHFHRRQSYGHCHYVGSPWQTKADERGDPKGFAVLYPDGHLAYQDRSWGPRHHLVEVQGPEGLAALLASAAPGDKVKVTVPEDQVEKVSRQLAGRFQDLVVAPISLSVASSRALPERALTLREQAERYVRDRGRALDPAELMAEFSRLTS